MDKLSIEEMALGFCKDRMIVVAQLREQAKELDIKAEGVRKQADELEKLVQKCMEEIKKKQENPDV